ncbi:hypothetical protein KMZ93_13370 [Bradyrhizobium sediminis]|jgi:uncharacterized membrane protein YkvI|uniref:Uncharacterized protein n=1 Tax=Bradyrhizobium sediminis TaxID=2840469 RepID=A0A975NTG0_9BRAD|nr:hypothetical protein [Bradyrhizobium sediminis]QWG21053.1 hypothetical protein KMZ93_13370 [Bradyrhizobium sediminis]
MQNSIGTIIAAVVISVALLVLFRWELVAAGAGMATNGVYRLDRWTGAIVACGQRANPPVTLDCEPK